MLAVEKRGGAPLTMGDALAELLTNITWATRASERCCEAECRRRAVERVAEPVYHHGAIVGYRQRYSDPCLLALLSAYRPERFKHRHQHLEKDGRPLGPPVVHVSYEKMKHDDEK